MDRVRVIRVLEYEGSREWVEYSLSQRGVKGIKVMDNGGTIREAIVGDFPAIVEEVKEERVPYILSVREDKFMRRFGWEMSIATGKGVKHDLQTGKVLAHEGDETWTRDLKVAGE